MHGVMDIESQQSWHTETTKSAIESHYQNNTSQKKYIHHRNVKWDPLMDHSPIRKTFELGKLITNHWHSWKEHPKFYKIVKLGYKIS